MAYIQLQLRRGTASQWTFANPVLANGELGLETDTRLYKIGDGVTYWNSLAYGSIGAISTSSLNISNTTSSTGTSTGALVIKGGAGIGGNLYVGGSIYINGQQVGAQSNTATNIAGGTTGSIPIQSNTGLTGFIPIGGTGSVLYSDGTTATWQTVSGLSNVNATNVYVQQTSEDRNAGGIFYPTMVSAYDTDIQMDAVSTVTWDDTNNILSSPKILVTATNASVSTITGALTVAGGIGIGKGLYVGGIVTATNMFLNGYQVSTSSALSIQLSGASQGTASTINFGTGTTVSVGANIATVQSADTLQLVTNRGASTTNAVTVNNSTQSTSTASGALQVIGGVGIGGNLYVGGIVTATNMFLNGYQVSTSSALAIQLAGVSQGTASTINFGTGTTVSVGANIATVQSADTLQLVTGRGASTTNAVTVNNSTQSTSTASGALQVTGGVGVGGNIYAAGSLNASALTITENGTGNQYALTMKGSGSGDQWAFTVGSSAGNNNITSLNSAGTVYAPFTVNGSTFTIGTIGAGATTSLSINNSGNVSIVASTASTGTLTGALTVVGGVGIGGNLYVGGNITANQITVNYTTITQTIVTSPDIFTITNTTVSSSTATGALTVVGGVGIGNNLYVGGNTTLNGSLTFANISTLASPKLQAYQETVTTIGTVGGATNINCALSNIFDITLGAASVTFTFTNPPASGTAQPITIILRQDATGSRLATFTNAKYTDGSVPVLSTGANQIDVLTFFTVNGGAFWFGTFAMANVS